MYSAEVAASQRHPRLGFLRLARAAQLAIHLPDPAAQAGMSLEAVQAQAGHTSIESTRIYLHHYGR